jgi:hypothetical protein
MINQSIKYDPETLHRRFVERVVEHALTEVSLDGDGLRRLISNRTEFQADIMASVQKHATSHLFANEEVESEHGYLSGYRTKDITTQTNRLRELFPNIGYADEKLASRPLPPNAEGWFAIPRWDKIGQSYNETVEKVFRMISKTRDDKFSNSRIGRVGPQYLCQHERTIAILRRLGDQQRGYDILIVPAQFGFRHRGRSTRRAKEMFNESEFGLGALAVGTMLLTHPERLLHDEDLWIDCPGDTYSFDGDGRLEGTPCFLFSGGIVKFDATLSEIARSDEGSASGFAS